MNNQLSFEGFVKHTGNIKGKKEPIIAITAAGCISCNTFLTKKLLEHFNSVDIYYNKHTSTVALELFKDSKEGSYALGRDKSTIVIAAKTFSKANNIKTPAKTEYLGTSDNDTIIYFKILN